MSTQCEIKKISCDEMGKIIQENYKHRINDDWDVLQDWLIDLPKRDDVPEDEEYETYFYFRIQKDTLEVEASAVVSSQYWGGESQSEYWTANIMVFGDTSKEELLEFDCADNCGYYDDPECYNSELLAFKGWFIPVSNIYGSIETQEGTQKISFMPRGIFKTPETEELPSNCFNSLDESLGNQLLVIRRG